MELDRDTLLQIFVTDSTESLLVVEDSLVALEDQPDDKDLAQEVLRLVHTIKGEAMCVELGSIAEFAHSMEDALDAVDEGTLPVTSALISVLLEMVDGLRRLVELVIKQEDQAELQPAHRSSMEGLRRFLEDIEDVDGNARREEHPSPVEPVQAASTLSGGGGTLRVDVEKLDALLNVAGEILIARDRVSQMLESPGDHTHRDILEVFRETDQLHLDLQDIAMKVRMVPIGPVLRAYTRTVRDLAQSQGKIARLEIDGEEVEVDTAIVERLRAPLTHMVRNAIDHGIESPDDRIAAGKEPGACVGLRATHEGGNIVIEVSDDGRGLSRERILARARTLDPSANFDDLSDEEVHQFIFEPGFSTADVVTELSGRGVGMNIVRDTIDGLRGVVDISSTAGVGTTIRLRIPLTLAIIDGFCVGAGDETYVIPLDTIHECLDMPPEQRGGRGAYGWTSLRGAPLPYVRLRKFFGLGGEPSDRENIVVVGQGGMRVGLAVDVLHGENHTVIKPLGTLFHDLPGIVGSAILGTGRVALILDVPGLIEDVLDRTSRDHEHILPAPPPGTQQKEL